MFVSVRTMLIFTISLCAVIGISKGLRFGPINSSAIVGMLSEKYYPLTDADTIVADDVTFALDKFRSRMDKGIYPVPPLDSYHRETLRPIVFDGINSPIIGELDIYNATITGLKEYSLDLIETRLKTSRLDFKISVPSLLIEADYKANFVDKELFLFDTGHMRVLLKHVQVTGATSFKKVVTKERKFYIPVGLGLNIHIKDCEIFTMPRKITIPPSEFIQNIIDVVTYSVTNNVMDQVKEILYLLPG